MATPKYWVWFKIHFETFSETIKWVWVVIKIYNLKSAIFRYKTKSGYDLSIYFFIFNIDGLFKNFNF